MAIPNNTPPQPKESKRFEIALQTRQFEIDLVWKRSLFFWGFIAAAFIAIGSLKTEQPGLSLLVASFGLVCSLAWTLANRGSKYWQEQWESKLENVEDDVIGPFFKNREPRQSKGFWGGHPYSVSRLAILVSDFVCLIWFLVLIRQCFLCIALRSTQFGTLRRYGALTIFAGTVAAIVVVVLRGRSNLIVENARKRDDPTVTDSDLMKTRWADGGQSADKNNK